MTTDRWSTSYWVPLKATASLDDWSSRCRWAPHSSCLCRLHIFECQQRWNVLIGLFSLVKFKFDFSLTLRLPENAGRLTFAECRLHFSCVFRLVLGNGLLGVFIWGQEIAAVSFSKSVKLDSHSIQTNCYICMTEGCVRNTMAGWYEELQWCRR